MKQEYTLSLQKLVALMNWAFNQGKNSGREWLYRARRNELMEKIK
jgi:hypothetical protein